MYPIVLRAQARELHGQGMALRAVARKLSVPYHCIRYWCSITRTPDSFHDYRGECPRCADPPRHPADAQRYAYLLGQYLGDGYLALSPRVPVLRIACANAYPGIMDECEEAMRSLVAKSVQRVSRDGCTYVQAVSKHWPCLFPQAGPGRKHSRTIVLEQWQRQIAEAHAGRLVRGLFHSDGTRVVNRVTVKGQVYRYPRYFFYNESSEILGICGDALDRLGVAWRRNRRNSLSVAKREAVSTLDGWVGAKR
ncbi:hypothetical protein Rhe02_30840 [Rhizocola hellebori]|uniref:Transcriptional regulator n=1 Tax=Rhizocola hellebori TaxID=1392758 RepID=A0A8J3Q874_9ACTN|nr:transcriptional regulator [Rhizocola hellebori]GIH05017.1 hypothetical protein Rhe02_30840 [Rhizocola hellebori]